MKRDNAEILSREVLSWHAAREPNWMRYDQILSGSYRGEPRLSPGKTSQRTVRLVLV